MNESASEHELEAAISRLLRAGVMLSAGLLAAGWLTSVCGRPAGAAITETGIRVLMTTPILRVAATFGLFVRQRDLTYIVITAIVLTILAIGVFGGIEL